MNGIELDTVELAYLLATVDATGAFGLEEARLFPTEVSAREATFSAGLEALKAHGWMKPISQYPGEFDLDSALLYLISIIAEPEFVIATTRQAPGGERQLALHYLAEPSIVELSATTDQRYRLGLVNDRAALSARIQQMLAVSNFAAPFTFTLEESVFTTLRGVIAQDQPEQATMLLKQAGVNGAHGESFIAALQASAEGQVVVVRPGRGDEAAGRRAWVFVQPGAAWLVRRTNAETTLLQVETLQADTLPRLLEGFIKFLAVPA
jgi:hypothetical protein